MAPQTIKVAEYLFARLKQLGAESIHGVPGDYNLTLLDYVNPSGLLWVGSANELNAGYAADGYARIKGVGALITTYGVGELSAINAIACAFTERAAVVHIVGTPARSSQDSRAMIHHTLGDGDYRHFGQMAKHVTAAQTNLLDPLTAPEQIDHVLQQCLIHSRPVYIEVPVDMVDKPVLAEALEHGIRVPQPAHDPNLDATLTTVLERMHSAKRPIIIVDGEARGMKILDSVQSLVTSTNWPTFTTAFGAGLVDMTATNVYGIYQGKFADQRTRKLVDNADLVLSFGPHSSTTNTYFLTSVPKVDVNISFTQAGIRVGAEMHYQVSTRHTLSELLKRVEMKKLAKYQEEVDLPRLELLSFNDVKPEQELRHNKVWKLLGQFLRPGDIVMGETGTPAYGVREIPFTKHMRLFTSVTWLSIGYMLPACQGAALAQQELISANKYHDLSEARTILFIGDGSFQMTVQELATIIRHQLDVVVFLVNNNGYTIERCIHGMNQKYNDISPWRYLKAPEFLGAPEETFTSSVRTYGELETLLKDEKLAGGKGLRMVEIILDQNDAPDGPLIDLIDKQLRPNGTAKA